MQSAETYHKKFNGHRNFNTSSHWRIYPQLEYIEKDYTHRRNTKGDPIRIRQIRAYLVEILFEKKRMLRKLENVNYTPVSI